MPACAIEFSDHAVKAVLAALPPRTPPERVKLLPAILRAWAQEDLREHLSRSGRAVIRAREERLQAVRKLTKDLLVAFFGLDERGLFEVALRPQMHLESAEPWHVDLKIANERRDSAIFWLNDLVEALNEPQPIPKPDIYTRHYLVMRDMAAIFEVITGDPATRRTRTGIDEGTPYGPFWNFAKALWSTIYGNERRLQSAVKIWGQEVSRQTKLVQAGVARAEAVLGRRLDPKNDEIIVQRIVSRCRSSSPFVANLQFRHRSLWRKLKPATR